MAGDVGARAWKRRLLQSLNVALCLERQIADFADQCLKLIVARDEIGFRIHFDDRAVAAVTR